MTASSFQPLVPEGRSLEPLLARAAELIAEGHRLEAAAGQLSGPLAPLLRAMNSYYTNQCRSVSAQGIEII